MITSQTKDIIKRYKIKMIKSLGQNFLIDDSIIENIVDAALINKNDSVIEIGPGIGNMTKYLAEKAGRVFAVEIDKHLIPALRQNISSYKNIDIINEDILKTDLGKLINDAKAEGASVKVVANLPYYITTPVVMRFLEETQGIDSLIFMMQKEVADRILATPGGKVYGALTVVVQYYACAERLFDVPPHCFIPQPEVTSTVLKMDIIKEPPVELVNKETFFKTIKAAFGQRRKTLQNALINSGYFGKTKEEIAQIITSIGIDINRRGETLTINQFAQLSNLLSTK